MASVVIPVPPREEQERILDHVEKESKILAEITDQSARAVALLQERRSALISAAVTGKIDVRGLASISIPKKKPYSAGFSRQLLAAEVLHNCYADPTTGRVKLQKLIHLCEHLAEIEEINAEYEREAAGPFDHKMMFAVAAGLKKQRWFSEDKQEGRTIYRPLEKFGEHQKYLAQWESKLPKIRLVLDLLGKAKTQQCEIVSTLYAAWNDLLIEGRAPSDAEIIRDASSPDRWHEKKALIEPAKWPNALQWMRQNGLVPTGWGRHTRHTSANVANDVQQAEEPAFEPA